MNEAGIMIIGLIVACGIACCLILVIPIVAIIWRMRRDKKKR